MFKKKGRERQTDRQRDRDRETETEIFEPKRCIFLTNKQANKNDLF